ncbi:MAG: S-methyl-5'-thioadenosine phosphorylase [Elusimicrobia bacterium]|nr:S-methyl-5'-thioadenosine phosphorylase [Elusimicrobiota bacterium]
MKTALARIGVIGGSGLYNMEGCRLIREIRAKTPFGEPSDSIALVDVAGVPVAFLPRHGKGHRILPTEINFRANIYALKSLGVRRLISVGATGSLREELAPMDLVVADQLVDKTRHRTQTFFGSGIVAHVQFDKPFCSTLRSLLSSEAGALNIRHHDSGVYVCMEGPAFSTKAESLEHKKLGYSIVGMTALPEAKLAREAEMCFALLAFVTDYDCWKDTEEAVNAMKVVENLKQGVGYVQRVLKSAIPKLAAAGETSCGCQNALASAIVTDFAYMNKATVKKLDLLVGKYLKKKAGSWKQEVGSRKKAVVSS